MTARLARSPVAGIDVGRELPLHIVGDHVDDQRLHAPVDLIRRYRAIRGNGEFDLDHGAVREPSAAGTG